jgi:hypothetical protein
MMGNRGCLHGQDRQLGASRWRSQRWICCVLDWKGVRRDPMPPGRWTALFFLDEATALAAGHRPCAYCRRQDYLDFTGAWRAARRLPRPPQASEMDPVLHRERTGRLRQKVTHRARAGDLPDGVMIWTGGGAALLLDGRLLPWSFHGYVAPAGPCPAGAVEVLTPPSIVATIAAGYKPLVHPTALTGRPPAGGTPSGVRTYSGDW